MEVSEIRSYCQYDVDGLLLRNRSGNVATQPEAEFLLGKGGSQVTTHRLIDPLHFSSGHHNGKTRTLPHLTQYSAAISQEAMKSNYDCKVFSHSASLHSYNAASTPQVTIQHGKTLKEEVKTPSDPTINTCTGKTS
ncbi:hypothetical protein E2C01_003431 [Portunus trituberculatus]|uniref:Uncharacterized protein n=1 Tax=Portunus trituberculatus TaxID=210409 RepID=A0A5B7CPS2_PORTR|nr:hypothetical protein [Portunus trituberculatus]